MGATVQWNNPWLMAQDPSYPDNSFGKGFPGLYTPKLERPPSPIVTTHQECVLAENVRDAGVRLDDFNPGFNDVTMGTYGRSGAVIRGSAVVMPTSVLGTATILHAPSPHVTQVHTPPVSQLHPPIQVSSVPNESLISTGTLDVKPEPVTTPSPGPSSINQVKEELRHLISSRQPQASTSTGQETEEGHENYVDSPPHIQNGVDLERQERRREQNRQAAQRCRKRKRDLADTLNRECQALECSNTELQFKVRTLERERDELRRLWNAHVQRHRCVASAAVKSRLASPITMETNSTNTTNITESMPPVLTQARRVDQSQHNVSPVTRTSQDMGTIVATSSASVTSVHSIGVADTATLAVSAENIPLSPNWYTDATQNSPQ